MKTQRQEMMNCLEHLLPDGPFGEVALKRFLQIIESYGYTIVKKADFTFEKTLNDEQRNRLNLIRAQVMEKLTAEEAEVILDNGL